jgi:hypothetical protein
VRVWESDSWGAQKLRVHTFKSRKCAGHSAASLGGALDGHSYRFSAQNQAPPRSCELE